ncbi:MAG: hypothetical protein ABSA41_21580 [Terriglobia bacterium]
MRPRRRLTVIPEPARIQRAAIPAKTQIHRIVIPAQVGVYNLVYPSRFQPFFTCRFALPTK